MLCDRWVTHSNDAGSPPYGVSGVVKMSNLLLLVLAKRGARYLFPLGLCAGHTCSNSL